MDLAPEGAPLEVKFQVNSMAGHPARDGGKNVVGLRVARVNHDCRPNAGYIYDETARVEIIFSQREIEPGVEVCICYCSFASLNTERPMPATARLNPEAEFQFIQQTLLNTWGITCPAGCYCKDPTARQLVLEGRCIKNKVDFQAGRGWIEDALNSGEKLLDIQRRLNLSWICKTGTELYLFQIAVRSRKTLDQAEPYIKAVNQVYSIICPYSESTSRKYEKLLSDPENDGNYMIMERIR